MAVVEDQRRRQHTDAPNAPRTSRPIPGDFSDAQVELGRVPQVNASAMGAPGRAIAQVGAAFAEMGGHINARQKKDEGFAASKAYAELQNGITQDLVDHEDGSLPDGTDHTLNWEPKWQARVDEFNGKVSPEQRQRYEADVTRMGGKYNLKAGEYETGKRLKYQSNELTKYLTPQLKILKAHPTQEGLETVRGISHNMINNMDLPPEQKAQLLFDLDENLSLTRLDGLAETDPKTAIAELQERITTLEAVKPAQIQKNDGKISDFKVNDLRNKNTRDKHKRSSKIQGVVIHHTGGSSLNGAIEHGKKSGTGTQYYVTADGTVHQYADDTMKTVHMRSHGDRYRTDKGKWKHLNNNSTIGVEVVAKDDASVTPAQKKATAGLIRHLQGKYGFASSNVVGHGELQGGAGGNKRAAEGRSVMSFVRNKGGNEGVAVAEEFRNGTKEGFAPQGIDQTNERRKAQYGVLLVKAEKKLAKMKETQEQDQMLQDVLSGERKVSPYDTGFMKQLNKAYESRFGADLNLLGNTPEAALGLQIAKAKAPFPKRMMQSLRGSMESEDPGVQLKAFQYADKLMRANPSAFKAGTNGVELGAKIEWFRQRAEFGGGENAIATMNGLNEHATKMNKEQRTKARSELMTKLADTNFTDQFDAGIADWEPAVPITQHQKDTIMSEYRMLVSDGFDTHGNADRAKAEAMFKIKGRYGSTDFSDGEVLMKYPPESFIIPDDIKHAHTQFTEAQDQALERAQPQIDFWKKQGWKPAGKPVLLSDGATRKSVERWEQGQEHNEQVTVMHGMTADLPTRQLPTWRFQIPMVNDDGKTAHFLLDDRFVIGGIEQRKWDRASAEQGRAIAREELDAEGGLHDLALHNILRRWRGYENTEVVDKITKNDPFKDDK